MADTLTQKPKLQLRSGLSFSEKTPSPSATKLMINHGKPNFTIQRTSKSPQLNEIDTSNNPPSQNSPRSPSELITSNGGTLTIINNNNNNEIIFKNTNGQAGLEVSAKTQKFNGVLKPANVPLTAEQENEVAKVVLRHVKRSTPLRETLDEDDGLPEFIRRQRRIQERLAKEGLDFENRRSGYFTQVLISPTTPNQRTSFVETMSSPAIVPALEMPPAIPSSTPPPTSKQTMQVPEAELITIASATIADVDSYTEKNQEKEVKEEQDEVADAIEEMNKAVADEDDEELLNEPLAQADTSTASDSANDPSKQVTIAAEVAVGEIIQIAVAQVQEPIVSENGHTDDAIMDAAVDADTILDLNGDAKAEVVQQLQKPGIPTPDPSGALGVNFEPKTIVSFSKDLGAEPNKYPDTVKLIDVSADDAAVDGELAELTKLKFDIKTDEQDVQVTPVLRAE